MAKQKKASGGDRKYHLDEKCDEIKSHGPAPLEVCLDCFRRFLERLVGCPALERRVCPCLWSYSQGSSTDAVVGQNRYLLKST